MSLTRDEMPVVFSTSSCIDARRMSIRPPSDWGAVGVSPGGATAVDAPTPCGRGAGTGAGEDWRAVLHATLNARRQSMATAVGCDTVRVGVGECVMTRRRAG